MNLPLQSSRGVLMESKEMVCPELCLLIIYSLLITFKGFKAWIEFHGGQASLEIGPAIWKSLKLQTPLSGARGDTLL
jgi:hypothetical protein